MFTGTEGWARGRGGWGILASEKRLRVPACRLGQVSPTHLWSSWGVHVVQQLTIPMFPAPPEASV